MSAQRRQREAIFRNYTSKLGYEVARIATAQFSTRVDKIQAGTHGHPASRKRPNFCRHRSGMNLWKHFRFHAQET